MSLPSFIQSLNVLERCGLAASRKKCRVRMWELQCETFAATGCWLAAQNRVREQRLDRLDAHLFDKMEDR